MTEYTAHFRFPIPDFIMEPWHALLQTGLRNIDTAIHNALLTQNIADWANNKAYAVSDIVIDAALDGSIWVCGIAHTSPASPTTFLSFRNANPTYWNSPVDLPTNRGAWVTATSYQVGDFVTNAGRYAVCIVSHVSGVFNTDAGAGKWSILIDLSTLGVGINAGPVDTIAAAATMDVGSKTSTRLTVTGSTGPIISLGNVPDVFKILTYTGTPTMNHNATSLVMLGGANRAMRAGDIQMLMSDSSQNWHELFFARGDGNPATTTERGVVQLATNAEAAALNDTGKAITPATAKVAWLAMIPATTAMLFMQAAVPTGWTKVTTGAYNDAAIRITTGSGGGTGGSSGFNTVFAKTATDGHSLITGELAAHNHTGVTLGQSVDHTHPAVVLANIPQGTLGNALQGATAGSTSGTSNDHVHGLAIDNAGVGNAHTHPMDIRVKYVDSVVGTRDA